MKATTQQHGGGLRSEMFLTVAAVGSNSTSRNAFITKVLKPAE
jgi:hypothetical protein